MKTRILKALTNNILEDEEIEEKKFINEQIIDKGYDERKEVFNRTVEAIITTPTSEKGGLIAITGFYYQMLVVIEYIIEMIDGKWDYVGIELHDDIVVIKDNKIKFIQVKTSDTLSSHINEYPANQILKRSSKKLNKDGVEERLSISNNWIDKLISKAKYFKKSDGFDTEFELVTNFFIFNNDKIDIQKYINSETKSISSDDSIYSKIINESFVYDSSNKNYLKVDYLDQYGEDLESLLSRFRIKAEGENLCKIDEYIHRICHKIGKVIGEMYVSEDDIHWIIGDLCKRCNVGARHKELIITIEESQLILQEIRTRAANRAGAKSRNYDVEQLIEGVHESIHNKYKKSNNYEHISEKISLYKEYLIDWINENGGIDRVINRYKSGKKINSRYIERDKRTKENILEELIMIPIILELIYESKIEYIKSASLLTKEVKLGNGCEKIRLALIGLSEGPVSDKEEDIKNIISSIEEEEISSLYTTDEFNIILQGYTDRRFNCRRVLNIENQTEEDKKLDTLGSINKVFSTAFLIPGEEIKSELNEKFFREGWDSKCLKNLWKEIMEG